VTCPCLFIRAYSSISIKENIAAPSARNHYRPAVLALAMACQYIALPVAGCRVSQNAPKIQKAAHQPNIFRV